MKAGTGWGTCVHHTTACFAVTDLDFRDGSGAAPARITREATAKAQSEGEDDIFDRTERFVFEKITRINLYFIINTINF